MSINDAVNLFSKDSPLKILEKDVIYCFGMSK